ncbi:MAG: hypothetical protein HQ547_06920 [Candidatus Omnitrophica bacterium]|nr:hypothetical protein [Candidatus Omnitrophota bacterium]
MLLLIYLRGLYCRFGNIFTWKNKTIIDDLGIDRRTLQRSRLLFREKGIIDFVSGKGQASTEYLILDTVLAPEKPVRKDKNVRSIAKNALRRGHFAPSLYKRYENNKERKDFQRFKGISSEDRAFLKKKGVF